MGGVTVDDGGPVVIEAVKFSRAYTDSARNVDSNWSLHHAEHLTATNYVRLYDHSQCKYSHLLIETFPIMVHTLHRTNAQESEQIVWNSLPSEKSVFIVLIFQCGLLWVFFWCML